MYTKQNEIIQFANAFLKDVTIEEIKAFVKDLQIELTKEQISDWLLRVAKEKGVDMVGDREAWITRSIAEMNSNMISRIAKEFVAEEERKKYILNETDYNMYARALEVY